ncbi:MAG: thermonuclease family protein [Thermodesulfobacteriota bacterium]
MNIKLCTFVITFIILISGCGQYKKVADELSFLHPDEFQCTVLRVDSGEKFLCELPGLDYENIRIVGITVPKDKAQEAKEYCKSILKRGTLIKIEPGAQTRDSNGDIPAYVFLPGNRMLNLLLVEKGFAELNVEEITKYKGQFLEVSEQTETIIIEENDSIRDIITK